MEELKNLQILQYEGRDIRFGEYESKKWYCAIDIEYALDYGHKSSCFDLIPPRNKMFFFLPDTKASGKFTCFDHLGVVRFIGHLDIPKSRKQHILRALFPDLVDKLKKELANESWCVEIDRKSIISNYDQNWGILRSIQYRGKTWFPTSDLKKLQRVKLYPSWLVKDIPPESLQKFSVVGFHNCIAGIKLQAIDFDGVCALLPKMLESKFWQFELKQFCQHIMNGSSQDSSKSDAPLDSIKKMIAEQKAQIAKIESMLPS